MINVRTDKALDLSITNEKRIHQFLTLDTDFEINYSKNAKRLIKKSNKIYTYQIINCINELVELINQYVAHKIKEFTPENISKLKQLMINATKNNKGETIAVLHDNKIIGAGYFLKDKSRITYLKGALTDEAKKNGAMFGLMDFAFNLYKSNYKTFDFGGSNVDSVATFYKKFGARDQTYFEYQINNLPLWFKGLKKLKK